MKYLSILAVPLLLLTFSGCKSHAKDKNKGAEKQAPLVDVLIAHQSAFPSTIEVNGSVLSEDMVELHPEANGRLVYLNIPDGAYVTAGTVLARVNDADLQAQMAQQKIQLEMAEKTEQRLKKLLTINGVDQASYDAALSQVNLYNANINVLKVQIDKTVVKAPFSGKLGLRLVSPGAYITTATAIGTIQKTDQIKVDFAIPEAYLPFVKVGQTVRVSGVSSPDTLRATVAAIEPQVQSATRNFKIRARLTKGLLPPGSFVKVFISMNGSGIVVPTSAILPDALSNQVVLVKNGKAVLQNVEIGNRNSDNVAIVSGVETGDSIVVGGILFARPNAPVKVKKVINR